MKVIAFVHAKSNSKRVKNKNLKLLGNKPLFTYAIENASNANLVDEVVIDSDSDKILSIGNKYGATILKRPTALANNNTTGDDLMYWQANNYKNSDIIVQVVPTSPFIKSATIDKCVELLKQYEYKDSVVGCRKEMLYKWINDKPSYYKNNRIPNSYELEPTIYETTGLYMTRTKFVLKHHKRLNPNKSIIKYLSKIESIDINTEEDFEFAETVLRGLKNE
jgi:CMP-N-acetylneuraminic acid synthetase